MDAQRLLLGVVKGDAQIVLLQHAPQRGCDLLKQAAKIQLADDGVIDFQKKPQPVALLGQLALMRLHGLEVQDVLDRHGHQARDLGEQAQVPGVIGARRALAKLMAPSRR